MLFNTSRRRGSSVLPGLMDQSMPSGPQATPQHRLSRLDPFYGESINQVLLDSLLFRKVVHEGPNSLLRAFSGVVYLNSQYSQDIE